MIRRKRPNNNTLLMAYLVHHVRVFIASLGYLMRQPLATMMTSAVIAIALALPTGLYVVLQNAGSLSAGWDGSTQISLFLKPDISEEQAGELARRLRQHAQIEHVDIIGKQQGLEQFQELSGFGDALQLLDENPLPVVLVIQPRTDPERPDRVSHLLKELQGEDKVDLAQLDMLWVKRLYTLIEVAERGVWIIGCLLGLAVLLIIGNTIRLDIQNRREEIEVSKLIGASNAFIRRPFLYTGLWYGLGGGLLAWVLTAISLELLESPLHRLTSLYHSSFRLSGLNETNILFLIGISCLLGLAGSWLAVGRHLSAIEPS